MANTMYVYHDSTTPEKAEYIVPALGQYLTNGIDVGQALTRRWGYLDFKYFLPTFVQYPMLTRVHNSLFLVYPKLRFRDPGWSLKKQKIFFSSTSILGVIIDNMKGLFITWTTRTLHFIGLIIYNQQCTSSQSVVYAAQISGTYDILVARNRITMFNAVNFSQYILGRVPWRKHNNLFNCCIDKSINPQRACSTPT